MTQKTPQQFSFGGKKGRLTVWPTEEEEKGQTE